MLTKKKLAAPVEDVQETLNLQEFLDMIMPSTIRFYNDYFICGNTYRSVWAIREYPTETTDHGGVF